MRDWETMTEMLLQDTGEKIKHSVQISLLYAITSYLTHVFALQMKSKVSFICFYCFVFYYLLLHQTFLLSGLMYEEEGALIELMMCAMRQAAQASPPVGRTQGKKVETRTIHA